MHGIVLAHLSIADVQLASIKHRLLLLVHWQGTYLGTLALPCCGLPVYIHILVCIPAINLLPHTCLCICSARMQLFCIPCTYDSFFPCLCACALQGAYITALGELHTIPPHWAAIGPVDTCGAGDAFAAGVLYAVLAGHDLRTAGRFASRVASAVIGRFGPHLSVDDADELVAELPAATADGGVARRALRRQGLASINGSMSGSMDEMDYQWSV